MNSKYKGPYPYREGKDHGRYGGSKDENPYIGHEKEHYEGRWLDGWREGIEEYLENCAHHEELCIQKKQEQATLSHILQPLNENFTPLQRDALEEMVRRLLEVAK